MVLIETWIASREHSGEALGAQRGNPFWQFMGSMLGLPPPTGGTISNRVVVIPDRADDMAIAAAANAPPVVTVADLMKEAGTHVGRPSAPAR
jgi:hypothetical protein